MTDLALATVTQVSPLAITPDGQTTQVLADYKLSGADPILNDRVAYVQIGRQVAVFAPPHHPGDIKLAAYSPGSSGVDWHPCDGSALSRSTYARLFGVIGTAFGIGDGSTTFNVPDLRNNFPRGATTVGGTGGSTTHSHSTPDHTHGLSANGGAQIFADNNYIRIKSRGYGGFNFDNQVVGTNSSATGTTSNSTALEGNTDSGGGSTTGPPNVLPSLPPYVGVAFLIYAPVG